ncbi:hypothetical protein GCM10010360_59670 [Streptomyces nogalater]
MGRTYRHKHEGFNKTNDAIPAASGRRPDGFGALVAPAGYEPRGGVAYMPASWGSAPAAAVRRAGRSTVRGSRAKGPAVGVKHLGRQTKPLRREARGSAPARRRPAPAAGGARPLSSPVRVHTVPPSVVSATTRRSAAV